MKEIIFLLILFFLGSDIVAKQENKYRYADIPTPLLENANSVIRLNQCEIVVLSINEAVVKEKVAITILNEQGYDQSVLHEQYGKFTKIKSIDFRLFDSSGKQIKKVTEEDIYNRALYEYDYFTDARVRYYDFKYSNFPFTVEMEIEKKINSLFFIPDWHLINKYKTSLENGIFVIQYPSSFNLRYKINNVNKSFEKSQDYLKTILSIEVDNIKAIKYDPLLSNNYTLPQIELVFDEFEIHDHKGDCSSWRSFGKFFYELNKGRDSLPINIKNDVTKLTQDCTNDYEKISKLYNYLKTNTRYVSIQLGIGGWQTFDANYVAKNGYGDCKALSNYMMSLLKAANIKSYTAAVYAGERDVLDLRKDFVANVFNHIILCVPQKEDTIWVECTAKDIPAGYLSAFTSNRDVLLITENGGSVVHTPKYTYTDNVLSRNADVFLDLEENSVDSRVRIGYKGSFFDRKRESYYDGIKEQQKYLSSLISIPNFTATQSDTSETVLNKIPFLQETLSIKGAGLFTNTNSRLFIDPAFFSNKKNTIELPEKRDKPYRVYESFTINDTVRIHIPDGYEIESKPKDIVIYYPFGAFNCIYEVSNNELRVITQYKQFEGLYNKETYPDYLKLANIVNRHHNKVVFYKK